MIVLLTLLVLITNTNGCIRSKDAIHSSAVRITCPEDITKIAHRRTTSATVTWKRKDFRIESTHPIKAVFQTVPIHGASATVTKTFPEGVHRIQYKAVDEAGIIGSCSFSISVSVVRCDRLFNPNPHVGRLICDAGNVYGSMCTLSCYQGYKVVGSQTIYCTAEGHWSGDVPFCQITTCPDPGTPIHGTRFCTTVNHAYGSFCTFTCRHGHQLIGKDKLFCTSESGKTHWSAETPVCEPIQPPRVEVCPPDHVITTSDVPKTIQKPRILFRTASGDEAPYTCSHFGENNKHNFTLGVHVVTCTAFDPTFGDKATAVCRFTVHVKANPCRPLNQPQNGVLLCSRAQGGGTVRHETSCKLHCDKGFTLGRDAGDDRDTFVCDSSGNWLPSSVVSSCVKPIRPQEIKLPAEILYNTSDCSNSSYLRTIEIKFQAAVQAALRVSETGVCATNPGDCIVDEVNSHCRDLGDVSYDRYRRHLAVSADGRRYDAAAGVRYGGQAPDRRSDRRPATHYVLPVLFHFGTRVPESSGDWPDEYHNALRRLYGMFDTFETQVLAGSFSITHKVRDFYVEELRNSLAYHTEIAICDIGYEFKSSIKLCVPCGAGTYYDIDLEQCVLCSAGFYQNHWAQFSCKPCPPGSATIQRGATSQSQCVDIDECLSNPCQHNGRCIDGVSSYTCKCRAGFGGRNCENVVYDCSKHACQSGGLCIPTGPSTYTCQCKPNYFGEFCQIHIVDGGWSEWSEWATCSKSCDGGVTSRFRSCDNPSPNDKGKPCRGPSSEEKTCNRHSCPVCKRLRRPYQGNIQCRRIAEDDGFRCVVSCPKGYTFSAPVFPVYVCGRSTAYRWPHETPDNPRCTVPACTRLRAPDNMMYRFLLVAGMQCPPVNISHQLSPLIAEQARHLTNHLSCIRANTCTLSQPHVTCCRPANRTDQSPDPLDCLQAGSRTKRELANSDLTRPNGRSSNEAASRNQGVDVDDEFVAIDVVLNYRGRLDKERLDVAELGEKLMNATKSGQLHFVYNGHVIVPDKNQTKMITDVICPPGTVVSNTGTDCVECGPGSYYKTNPPVCIPCDVGYYQPEAGLSACRRCPDNQITFGRGAIVPEECYDKGTKPPNISEEVYYRLEFEMSRSPLYHVIPISIISCLVILTTAAIISVSTHVRSLICQGRNKDEKP